MITKSTSHFQILDPIDYLSVSPTFWDEITNKEIIQSLNVVNDHAECGMALIQTLNKFDLRFI